MLAVFLLVGCLVCGETLGFEYFDELYSYDDDDEEVEPTAYPGTDLARERRDPRPVIQTPQEFHDAEGDIKKIMVDRITSEANFNKWNTSVNTETSIPTTITDFDNFTTKFVASNTYNETNTSITTSITYYNRTKKIRDDQDNFIREKMKELQSLGKRYPGTTTVLNRGWLTRTNPLTNYIPVFQHTSKPPDLMNSTQSSNHSFNYGDDYETDTTTPDIETRTSTTFEFDADRVLEIVSNITYYSYKNLTEQLLNQAIQRMPSVKSKFKKGHLNNLRTDKPIARCYLCGIDHPGLPNDSACHDAFAGNSLSVFPIDHKSARYIKTYRYSCRYRDVPLYWPDGSKARSISGRFTGGCSVRWADITGMYTQRTCRAKKAPLIGKHFASKRMARLELLLKDKEEGCVASPAATLLPLSPSISLFARIHVCVCKGNFCNTTFRIDSDMWLTCGLAVTAVMLLLVSLEM